jgi:anti-anti-sigma factor
MGRPLSSEDDTVSVSELADDIVLIEAAGEIDASSAPRLQDKLISALRDGAAGVVLDLSAVAYMDSTGIAAVIAGYAEAKDRNARLAVICGEGHAGQRMRVMGLEALLDPVRSRQEARERVGAP